MMSIIGAKSSFIVYDTQYNTSSSTRFFTKIIKFNSTRWMLFTTTGKVHFTLITLDNLIYYTRYARTQRKPTTPLAYILRTYGVRRRRDRFLLLLYLVTVVFVVFVVGFFPFPDI